MVYISSFFIEVLDIFELIFKQNFYFYTIKKKRNKQIISGLFIPLITSIVYGLTPSFRFGTALSAAPPRTPPR